LFLFFSQVDTEKRRGGDFLAEREEIIGATGAVTNDTSTEHYTLAIIIE
jgi:hypothetical protein